MSADFGVDAPALVGLIDAVAEDIVAVRRDLHAHPELAWAEQRTTLLVAERLEAAGVKVQMLPRSGLMAEVGTESSGPIVALRADLDALPVRDLTDDPWRSTVDGVAHACGHDAHTACLLGAGLALAALDGREPLPGRVRLLFQPAEEIMPGGALEVIAGGGLDGVCQVYGVHCDPTLDVGTVGLRHGPITGAADALGVRLTGRGGHTSRPHLTQDLTYALAKLVTDLPAVLSRRLDATTWETAQEVVTQIIVEIVAPYGVQCEIDYVRGVPPVVNNAFATDLMAQAASSVLGPGTVTGTTQSLGGEDFAWYLESVPGAMARLGTREPAGPTYDLHQGDLRIDDRAVVAGARVLAASAMRALRMRSAGSDREPTDSITN